MPKDEPVPFSKYLVTVDPAVEMPQYLRNGNRLVDFKLLRKKEEPTAGEDNELAVVVQLAVDVAENLQIAEVDPGPRRPRLEPLLCDPLTMDRTLSPAILGMDRSQFDALRHSLCSELTVIQGPPGKIVVLQRKLIVGLRSSSSSLSLPPTLFQLFPACFPSLRLIVTWRNQARSVLRSILTTPYRTPFRTALLVPFAVP